VLAPSYIWSCHSGDGKEADGPGVALPGTVTKSTCSPGLPEPYRVCLIVHRRPAAPSSLDQPQLVWTYHGGILLLCMDAERLRKAQAIFCLQMGKTVVNYVGCIEHQSQSQASPPCTTLREPSYAHVVCIFSVHMIKRALGVNGKVLTSNPTRFF
jgi:hypothetical protein